MKQILNAVFPFAITLLLWRVSAPVWNPCGILSLVPIFYYSFIRPRPEFLPMAIIGCVLLDYNFDTTLFWTAAFCAAYAANYLQTALRSALATGGGIWAFMAFSGACILTLAIWSFRIESIGAAAWMIALSSMGYWIWSKIIKSDK